MKKVRVDVKEDSPGRRFWLFISAESLLDWIVACYKDPAKATESVPVGAHEVVLRNDDFMEAEWYGCEVVRQGKDSWKHLNLIRAAEVRSSDNSAGNVVTVHIGWVIDTIIPFHDYEDENIIVERIEDDESEVDMDELFKEKGIEF